MENLNWGEIPLLRQRKQESSTEPMVSMSALTKKGAGRKFAFNKAAQTVMGLQGEEFIAMAFAGTRIFVRVVAEGTENAYQLTKTCAFSNKRVYQSIGRLLELNDQLENSFKVIPVEGETYSELVLQDTTEVSATPEIKTEVVENGNSEEFDNATVTEGNINTSEAIMDTETESETATETTSESTETGSEW